MGERGAVLRNRWVTARWEAGSGRLVHLSSDGRANRLTGTSLSYLDLDGRRWYRDEEGADHGRIALVAVESGEEFVATTHRSDHIELTLRYTLPAQSPLLRVEAIVKGIGRGRLGHLSLPRVRLGAGFNDAFEDEEDLYFDGAELPGGRELPCWRVFFRKGYRDGLILATRCKREMARFNILETAFDLEPNGRWNYVSMPVSGRDPLEARPGVEWRAAFEMGPWRREDHGRIARGAGLDAAAAAGHAAAAGRPPARGKGVILHAAALAGGAASQEYDPRRWRLARAPWSLGGTALFATTGVRPPVIEVRAGVRGLCRVRVGIGSGAGITLRAPGDPETRIRLRPNSHAPSRRGTFDLALAGRQTPAEVDFGVIRLDGGPLRIGRFPDLQSPCVFDYIRLEPLSPAAARRWERRRQTPTALPLCGFADVPDIAALIDAARPDPRTFAANIWEHAQAGVRKVYWRVDGQCSDFPCSCNTMRYVSARVHGVFCAHSKAYGRVLKKVDMLALAVDAARRYGVELWGWMRFNSYIGNVQSDFYKQHPEFWEETESGTRGRQLCLAYPEVRRHKIDILIEAARYGLAGLSLGFLRHPPIVQYAPVVCEAYERQYGKPPPRDRARADPAFKASWPESAGAEYERWWRFRAQYLTAFGRELRAALAGAGLGGVKVSIWVRPNHCLLDGIDLKTWLDEGLCDEVVSQGDGQGSPEEELNWEKPEWKAMVRARAPLIRTVPPNLAQARSMTRRILAEGYDGICSYESNDTVLDSRFIALFDSLRVSCKGMP